jgi:uncharacterized membrane protein YgaE (UPF0421/DUF939 family)
MAAAKELKKCPRSAGTGGHQEMAELTRCQRKDHKVHGSKNKGRGQDNVVPEEEDTIERLTPLLSSIDLSKNESGLFSKLFVLPSIN